MSCSIRVTGLKKGVTSGTTPIDVSGKDAVTREIYLGTCSKKCLYADPNVSNLTLNLVFTTLPASRAILQRLHAIISEI